MVKPFCRPPGQRWVQPRLINHTDPGAPRFRRSVVPAILGRGQPSMGRSNYAGCHGDTSDWVDTGLYRWEGVRWVTDTIQAQRVQASCRGVFVLRKRTSFRDTTDGLSNTIACGEIVTDLGDRDVRTAPHRSAGWYPGVHSNPRTCQPNRDSRRPQF